MKRRPIPPDADEPLQNWTDTTEGTEGEEDLGKDQLEEIRKTVVSASDWTTETILRQIEKENIKLNPEYQRREVWRAERKSRFIESLVLGLPIPQIVLAEDQHRKNSYLVIDGKQRLLTLSQFAARADKPPYEQLKLSGLKKRSDLNGMSLSDMQADPAFADDVRNFENQTIRTVVIKSWPNEDVLYMIFMRLNTGSVQLSTQELRQALHPGEFLKFVDERSGELEGLHRIFGSSKPDFRMRDAELMVRYYAYRNSLAEYKGNLKGFLDDLSKNLNGQWDERKREIEKQASDLDDALEATFEIFGNNAFKKWDGKEYENRFNRAIFDVMVFYFCHEGVRRRALLRKRRIEEAFQRLCSRNPEFVKSIESTTKSIGATATRLVLWGKVLRKSIGTVVKVPSVVGKNIVP